MSTDFVHVSTNFEELVNNQKVAYLRVTELGKKYNLEHGLPWQPTIEWFWDQFYCPHCHEPLFNIGSFSMFFYNEYCAIIHYPLCWKCAKKLERYSKTDHREGEFSEITEKNLIPVFLRWYETTK